MKKNMVYLVNGEEEVRTIAEVSEILGTKVTKKQIIAGDIEGVEYVESTLEVASDMDEDTTDADRELVDNIEDALEDDIEEVAEDTEDTIEEDTDTTEEIVEEVIEDTEEPVQEDTDTVEDTVEEPTEEVVGEEVDTTEDTEVKSEYTKEELAKMTLQEKLKLVTKPSQPKSAKKVDKYPEDKEIDFPEVGYFKSKEDMKEFYKPLQDSHLDQWIELEGLEWKESGNAGIDRMRRCMAISNLHFPSQSKAKKSKSKYADYSTEQLVEMCLDNDIELADAKGNLKILRMYAIMALRKASIIE